MQYCYFYNEEYYIIIPKEIKKIQEFSPILSPLKSYKITRLQTAAFSLQILLSHLMGLECCALIIDKNMTFFDSEQLCFLITTFRRNRFPMFFIETIGFVKSKLLTGEINYIEDNIIDVDELPSP